MRSSCEESEDTRRPIIDVRLSLVRTDNSCRPGASGYGLYFGEERYPNDDEPNSMLPRAQRAPYKLA